MNQIPKLIPLRIRWNPKVKTSYIDPNNTSQYIHFDEASIKSPEVENIIEEALNVYLIIYENGLKLRVINPTEVELI